MKGSAAWRWMFGLVALLVASLVGATGTLAQDAQPTSESGCSSLRAGDQVDAVLLLDQSTSMGVTATEEVRTGISTVGERLKTLLDQGVEVRWAIVGFGSESLATGRVLLPLSPLSPGAADYAELQESYVTQDLNTDYRAGLLGAREQLRGSTAECRLMLWFTDGQFDVGPGLEDSGDAPALLDAVCGNEPIAQWFQDSNVRSYVILSNNWDIDRWERKFNSRGVLEASLSAMQAITGSPKILDDREKGGREQQIAELLATKGYEIDAACQPFTQNRSEVGGIRLNAGDLDDIFDVLMSQLLGDTFVGECPATVPETGGQTGRSFVESPPLPDGLVLDQIQIYDLNGSETDLRVYAKTADDAVTAEISELTLRDKSIDASQIQQFRAGWKIEVEGPKTMEICISHPRPGQLASATVPVTLTSGPERPEAAQDSSQFAVDLSQLPLIAKASVAGRSSDGLLVGFGIYNDGQEDWSASWSGGTTATLTFAPRSEDRFESVDLYVDIFTVAGEPPSRVPVRGKLIPPIEATAPAGSPKFDCGDEQTREFQELGLNGGEVPLETFVSPIKCTISPPDDDVAVVEFSVFDPENSTFEDVGFVFETSLGQFRAGDSFEMRPGDDPVEFHFELAEPLENRTWKTNGTLRATLTWDRPGNEVAYQSDVNIEVPVDLIARADTGVALLYTLIAALLALLASLGVFRFMNSLIKIPLPDQFYYRSADIRIINASSDSPRFEWVDPTQFGERPDTPSAARPGSNLQAENFTLTRRLPPFFMPFKDVTARTSGMNVIHTWPARGYGKTPGSFIEMVLVGSDSRPDEADSLDARVVVLYPRREEKIPSDYNRDLGGLISPFASQVKDTSNPEAASKDQSDLTVEPTDPAAEGGGTTGSSENPPSRPPPRSSGPPPQPPGRSSGPPPQPPGRSSGPPPQPPGRSSGPPPQPPGRSSGPPPQPPKPSK